ncbi:MAG: DUF4388 domain-containing protein [Archangium sp.]|nr:DUF4388 domain-containing protein [Archangium sp.]
MDARFLVDARGFLAPADGGNSPLQGRTGYFRLQNSSPDWIVMLRSPAQGGMQETRPRVVLAGDCGAFHLADLIAFLGQSRWTGVLRVTAPSGERSLLLKDGDVRSAASDSSGDRIGEVMVRLGYVSRVALEKVLAESPPSRIGKALVERGLIKAHDLYKCLNEQISEIFHGIMLSKDGAFALIDQEIDEKALTHNLSLSMNGLLMDSIRKIDELAQFRKRIPHGRMYVLPRKPAEEELEPEEAAVFAQVDGRRTVIEVGQLARFSEFDATRIVHHLMEMGLVKVVEALAAPAVPVSSQSSVVEPVAAIPKKPVPAPPPKPVALSPEVVVEVFNTIFREVRDEVAARGTLEPFLISANAALKGNGVSTSPVLTGLMFSDDGKLDGAQLVSRYEQLTTEGHLGAEPIVSLKQALSDVMFFLLFQAGELLESAADEELARRVKEHLAALEPK